jgi:hypothetical protein
VAIADFATTAELLTYMRADATGVDASTSALAITAASDAIRQTCDRTFELQSTAADRYFTIKYPFSSNLGALAYLYPWPGVFPFTALSLGLPPTLLDVDDFFLTNQTIGNITVTDTISGTTYTPTQGWPYNAASQGAAYTKLVFAQGVVLPNGDGQLKVNAKWGWITVPTTVKNACLLQASRYVKRRDSPLGVAGFAEMGGVMRVLAKLDPDVIMMLNAFMRHWAAV